MVSPVHLILFSRVLGIKFTIRCSVNVLLFCDVANAGCFNAALLVTEKSLSEKLLVRETSHESGFKLLTTLKPLSARGLSRHFQIFVENARATTRRSEALVMRSSASD